ncbi:MAG: STAS domain-containing protein [Gammaproteobacteria bacterium]|nr:STAS domain-containing protein [Gammaproteobacteria bacterium]
MVEIKSENQAGVCQVHIVGDMTIYEADKLKEGLLSKLDDCQEMEINLSDVSEVDTAGVQVLMLAKQEAQRSAKALRLVSHSEAAMTVLDTFCLTRFFGDPIVLEAKAT